MITLANLICGLLCYSAFVVLPIAFAAVVVIRRENG